ncbi:MAG: succinyl-diaminopimelate desuccinylase [Actinomycetales bacterium]|nr:succinyl-diaminopimelate desuccinylase [Actinomycetales bacterium]
MALDLRAGVAGLAAQLVDLPSVSFQEALIADEVQAALASLPHLSVRRVRNCVVASTSLGRSSRVVLAGHLDTVPAAGNEKARIDAQAGVLHGLGSCDMKGGVAVMLRVLAAVAQPSRDVTAVFYDCEEVASEHNGLGLLAREHPEVLACDMAVLLEPSNAGIEAGCQGTLRAVVRTTGRRAHTARAWRGENAIHSAAPILARLAGYQPRTPVVEGLQFREGLQAVGIAGGVAGNVVPDACEVTVNHRFAPDRDVQQAQAHVREVFTGFEVEFTDCAAGALPGLGQPALADLIARVGSEPHPKLGWTDVARFAALGVPALNFGPGDPALAHAPDEHVLLEQIERCEQVLTAWLS